MHIAKFLTYDSVDALRQMDTADLDAYLIVIERALVSSSASPSEATSSRVAANSSRAASGSGAGSRGKLHVAAYLYHVCQDTDLSNHIVNSPLVRKMPVCIVCVYM